MKGDKGHSMDKAKYQLVVPLMYLSDVSPRFKENCKSLLDSVRVNNHIDSWATDYKMEGLRIEEIKP